MTESPLLQNLNPPQKEAVTTTDGPLLVISGAGTGKTRVVTRRIAYLISEGLAAPWQIFAATFTNRAAREMGGRIAGLCRSTDTARLAIATFHSHCARILRSECRCVGLTQRFSICDATDQTAVTRDCIQEAGQNPKYMSPADVLNVISLAKMRLLEGEAAEEHIKTLRGPEYAEVYRLYQRRLRASDAADFDDLLLLMVKIWTENPEILEIYQNRYRYIMVDEYQDTNLAQFEFLRLLSSKHRNLCVVGDEDQSIYSWRGAEITNLLEFQKRFPEARIIRLEQNYRSTSRILEAADAVIARNKQRLGKTLWADSQKGDPAVVIDAMSDQDEARIIANEILRLREGGLPLEEMALFYRVNALSRVYEDALRERDIPYRVIGGVRFYDRAEIKDILCYLQVVDNPTNTLALLRVLNRPRRGIGDAAVARLLAHADANGLALFELLIDPEKLAAAGLKGKAANGAAELGASLLGWAAQKEKTPLQKLLRKILNDTDYEASLGDPRSIEALSRAENIQEFENALGEYQEQRPEASLADFLENVALRGADEETKDDGGGVSLMTVHNAKGLEFDVVFIGALEDEIFPNGRAVRDQGTVEEERRLFYVAITRARKRVYLSYAHTRRLYGQPNWPTPSAFIHEIPVVLRVFYGDAQLGPLTRATKAGQSEAQETSPAPEAAKAGGAPKKAGAHHEPGARFEHEALGIVEIVSEEGEGAERRLAVRDAAGRSHTLLAAHARLRPLRQKASPQPEDEAMPF